MRSTRSSSRARRASQHGYALVIAIVLAVLYFALVELLLLDSSRELAEARRFRARVVAETLADNAVELAALHMVDNPKPMVPVKEESEQGTMQGVLALGEQGIFELRGTGTSTGVTESTAKIKLNGQIVEGKVWIDFSTHP